MGGRQPTLKPLKLFFKMLPLRESPWDHAVLKIDFTKCATAVNKDRASVNGASLRKNGSGFLFLI